MSRVVGERQLVVVSRSGLGGLELSFNPTSHELTSSLVKEKKLLIIPEF